MNVHTTIEPSLIGALAKALPELEGAKKNKANPAFKSKYADLSAVIEALEPIKAEGLWYRQHSHESSDGVMVETFYIHTSGEQLSAGSLFMPATKKDAQGFGSALSYARRYALQLAFGLATEDDDGNAAVKGQGQQKVALIDDAQWSELVQTMEAAEANTQAFCTAYSIKSLRDLPAEAFPRAMAQLRKKIDQLLTKEPA